MSMPATRMRREQHERGNTCPKNIGKNDEQELVGGLQAKRQLVWRNLRYICCMSDPTTTVQNRRTESDAFGHIVAMSNEAKDNINTGGASEDKPDAPPELATTARKRSEFRGMSNGISNFNEASLIHAESSTSGPIADTGTKSSRLPQTKPSSTRHSNSITSSDAMHNASEPCPKGGKNESGASASLLHRLAGPSVGKAGLARDQTEITRVIARASEGSKYYEVGRHCASGIGLNSNILTKVEQNERRKNEEVEKKVESLLKLRHDLRTMADIPRLEASADKIITELESTRDLSQKIVHVDMDSFYASIEVLRDPSLANKPFGVGSHNGVLSTASYAARAFGVRSGMATYIAKALCPGLVVVHMDWERIGAASESVMDILREYAGDPDGGEGCGMDIAGVDEAYVNITGYCKAHEIGPEECVEKIRAQIFEETKLTASAGIAPNKMLAKICSEKNKPNGQYFLPFDADAIKEFMQALPIRRIPGIGRVTERLLDAVEIRTCGDIYTHRATLALLDKYLHVHDKLYIYLGLGSNQIKPWAREARKSVGAERTFRAIEDPVKIQEKLELVARELESDLDRLGFAGHTVTLKVKLDTFELRSRAKSAHKPVRKYEELLAIGQELLTNELPLKLRLLGLRVTNLKDLRAPETGIKRFFGSAKDDAARPVKRRKLDTGTSEGNGVPAERPIYVVSDESDEETVANAKRAATATPEKSRTQTLPDVEVAPRASSHEPMGSQEAFAGSADRPLMERQRESGVRPVLPLSKGKRRNSDTVEGCAKEAERDTSKRSGQQHVCPICSKTLQTDNVGFNAHVDWCLSRSAILEASAAGSSNAAPQVKKSTTTKKPSSTNTSAKTGSSKGLNKSRKQDIRLAWKIS